MISRAGGSPVAASRSCSSCTGEPGDLELVRRDRGQRRVGVPADVTWLRLAHCVDRASGEHEFRAASSRDGQHWSWGGTWTFPAGAAPRIGLVSHGGNTPQFDYVRVYR
ncbi:MAG TPA: hypothetical protein VFM37_05580 [Pseudonocardiaceae bacterium]|nr:hypothetical protein [Pseudonocardiaceae bacterium]